MTDLQRAIIMGSIIGSLMSAYDPTKARERKKPISIIRARIKRAMFKRSRSNKKEFTEAIKVANEAWKTSVTHFLDDKITIETIATVMRLYDLYSVPLSRFFDLHEKQIQDFANGQDDFVFEEKSFEVADYIIDVLADETGIKREHKLSLRHRMIKDNIILERG